MATIIGFDKKVMKQFTCYHCGQLLSTRRLKTNLQIKQTKVPKFAV